MLEMLSGKTSFVFFRPVSVTRCPLACPAFNESAMPPLILLRLRI
jgi:hypothetical protein